MSVPIIAISGATGQLGRLVIEQLKTRLAEIARNNVPGLDADELRTCTEEQRHADEREVGG